VEILDRLIKNRSSLWAQDLGIPIEMMNQEKTDETNSHKGMEAMENKMKGKSALLGAHAPFLVKNPNFATAIF